MYTIRAMQPRDYADVRTLWEATEGIGLSQSDSREQITQFLERNPGLSFVALADAQIVATILCGHDGRRGYIHHLAVAETHRRRGIATALLDKSLAQLKTLNIHKCNLFLFRDNQIGQAYYKHKNWIFRDDLVVVQSVLFED
ncbi:MAG: GNAT family N-acetyltransferase [Chloroflexi bacterium]|nr:MAG: GNAT family N-acetyltransferase [Phototrophicales bacterium]RMF79234.1 MAG: GNAT family N-acetyltransferase [Chloroflexota bacterium]